MHVTRIAAVCIAFLMCAFLPAAEGTSQYLKIDIDQQSIRINNVELRSDVRIATLHYISSQAAEEALGAPQDTYIAGLGVRVYAWTNVGIHLQQGFRGPNKNKIFKFQIWLNNTYNKNEDKYSGKFLGNVCVEGVNVNSESTFESIRKDLENQGFKVKENSAQKGGITIFTIEEGNKIERIEVWCI